MKRVNTNPTIKTVQCPRKGFFPNSELPVLIYKNVISFPAEKEAAADIIQKIFIKNKWGNSWRNGIYGFHHYHSNTHECMGIAHGSAKLILGGPGGRKLSVKRGDVLIWPAGVGHKCLHCSGDFFCLGGYPRNKEYDTNLGTKDEFQISKKHIAKLAIPSNDPVLGKEGFLKIYWKKY